MSYRRKANKPYARHRPRRTQTHRKFKRKTTETDTTKFLGQPIITREKEREEEITPIPESIEEAKKKSLGFNIGNQVGNIGLSGSDEKKTTVKFVKRTNRKSIDKKRDYV